MKAITDTLSIGSATDGRLRGGEFERVVSLASKHDATTHWHPLPDGPHEYEAFEQAVTAVRDGLLEEQRVLVHCQAGLSRSVAVAIAALCTVEGYEFEDAYEVCQRGFIHPAPELVASAQQYIATEVE